MRNSTLFATMIALLFGAAALAGCTAPEEAQNDDADNDMINGDTSAETVSIDGRVFECDDSIRTGDEPCEEYVASDDPDAQAEMDATVNPDNTVTIGDATYECDDSFDVDVGNQSEGCEEYVILEEA